MMERMPLRKVTRRYSIIIIMIVVILASSFCSTGCELQIMEGIDMFEIEDSPLVPLSPTVLTPPSLRDGESYHVFISYSSTDSQWTHSLIEQLESCGLQVCYHERDFIPGRTILENMSDCIQESQKVLLLLSPEFVRSRWCLLEANMSLFRDCLERKPVIPVLLEPGVSVPAHLCHLTYQEASDPDFKSKLLKVLCTPNQQLQSSTVFPFQAPSIFNGKALQPLTAVNAEGLHQWNVGRFNDIEVPDQLRPIIEDHDKYREAVRIINSILSQTQVCLKRAKRLHCCGIAMWILLGLSLLGTVPLIFRAAYFLIPFIPCILFIEIGLMIQLGLWHKDEGNYIKSEMKKAVARANLLLHEDKVLMGCVSNSEISVVYVCLENCKQEFEETFSDQAEEMFQRALMFFSSGYSCCLTKRDFPFPHPRSTSHLDVAPCFCQYISQQLSANKWE